MLPERALSYVLSTLRAQQGLSQLQLAQAMGATSPSYLSKLENGRRTNPSRQFVRNYIAAYTLLGRPLSPEQRAELTGVLLALPEAA